MDYERAAAMVAAVVAHGRERGLRLSVVVVDERGYDVAVARMDAATWFTPGVARAKARSALAFGRPSADLAHLHDAYPEVLRLAGEQLPFTPTTLPGGLLVRAGESDDHPVVGAVGVSGATPEDDVAAAHIALSAYAG